MEEKKPEEFVGVVIILEGAGVFALEKIAVGDYKVSKRLGDRIEDGKIVKEKPLE